MVARQPLDHRVSQTERAADVAHRAARPVADDDAGQRRAFAAVFPVQILDHLLAPLVLEVDIDVGRLVALTADETLEQHRAARRVDLGDMQAEADHRVGGRTAPLAEDALTAGKRHDVGHGQEVMLIAELIDQGQFMLDLRAPARIDASGPASVHAGQRQGPQMGGGRDPGRNHLARVLVADFVEREVAQRGHDEGLRQQVGRILLRQPQPAAQMGFGIRLQVQPASGQRVVQPGGCHHILQRLARTQMHMDIAAGDQGQGGGGRQRAQPL